MGVPLALVDVSQLQLIAFNCRLSLVLATIQAGRAMARRAPSPCRWSQSIPPLRKIGNPKCKYFWCCMPPVSASNLDKLRKAPVLFAFGAFYPLIGRSGGPFPPCSRPLDADYRPIPIQTGYLPGWHGRIRPAAALRNDPIGAHRPDERWRTVPREGARACQLIGSSPQRLVSMRANDRPRPAA